MTERRADTRIRGNANFATRSLDQKPTLPFKRVRKRYIFALGRIDQIYHGRTVITAWPFKGWAIFKGPDGDGRVAPQLCIAHSPTLSPPMLEAREVEMIQRKVIRKK